MSCPNKATMYWVGLYWVGRRAPGQRYTVGHRVLPDAGAAGPCATSCA